MPVAKVTDIAFGRLQSPDLDQAEEFLLDFGLVRAARTKDALYMRGTDAAHHLHVTHLGEPKFIGFAYYARNEEDLDRLARVDGASKVETIDEPGGGKRVRLRDPHGFQIEVVHGIETPAPLPVRRNVVNWGPEKARRAGELTRLPAGPAQVKRMGHGSSPPPILPGRSADIARPSAFCARTMSGRATRAISFRPSIAAIAATTMSIITSFSR